MQHLTNKTIRNAIKPWKTSNPESHKTYAKIVKRFGHISKWNVSAVTDMSWIFCSAQAFNQDISAWNVSAVTNTSCMFISATAFNQDLSAWDVSAVTDMHYMFYLATAVNQDISAWDVSAVTNMNCMFKKSLLFDQILHKYKLTHPFNLLKTHIYHNWYRRKQFICTEVFTYNSTPKLFITQTVLDIPEMRQEIGLFV
jgi:surface protein